jgi:SSS family solute:Na+ symporter
VAGSTVVFVFSAFFWKPGDPKSASAVQLDRDLQTPVIELNPVVEHGAMGVYGVIGNLSIIIGLVLLACWFVPSTRVAPASINVLGGAILIGIGLVLRWVAKPPAAPDPEAGR